MLGEANQAVASCPFYQWCREGQLESYALSFGIVLLKSSLNTL